MASTVRQVKLGLRRNQARILTERQLMISIHRMLIVCLALLSTACGNLQDVKIAEVPADLRGTSWKLSPQRPAKEEIITGAFATVHEVPGRSMFLHQTSGGSLVVGLLLGIPGHLVNALNVERVTREMGESAEHSSHFQLDALKEAGAAWNLSGPDSFPEAFAGVRVKPYLVLYVPGDESGIHTIVGALVEKHPGPEQGAASAWRAKYLYALPTFHPMKTLSSPLSSEGLATYQQAIRAGYNEIRAELLRDLTAGLRPRRQIAWVKAPVLDPIGVPGDIERSPSGRLSLRVNLDNYGAFVEKLSQYVVWIFPSPQQYEFDNGPVERDPIP